MALAPAAAAKKYKKCCMNRFEYATLPDGYDALHALKKISFGNG